jgi:hypothetical protein
MLELRQGDHEVKGQLLYLLEMRSYLVRDTRTRACGYIRSSQLDR